jgi:hypothetical protein
VRCGGDVHFIEVLLIHMIHVESKSDLVRGNKVVWVVIVMLPCR